MKSDKDQHIFQNNVNDKSVTGVGKRYHVYFLGFFFLGGGGGVSFFSLVKANLEPFLMLQFLTKKKTVSEGTSSLTTHYEVNIR